MKQLTVLSGKGGTGKTTVVASFAFLADSVLIVDADVDAPDLHLLLSPTVVEAQEFKGSKLAVIDEGRCFKCGICRDHCRFEAISENIEIDCLACEGCGVCLAVCPSGAVTMVEQVVGKTFISRTRYGSMVHARLFPEQANSGKLVTLIRELARNLAEKENSCLIIIDGSPAIGCPVIASATAVDAALIITEPTMSGLHDLKRTSELLQHFSGRTFVAINKYDLNEEKTGEILEYCERNNLGLIGKIPFNPVVIRAMLEGKPVLEYAPQSDVSVELKKMWEKLRSFLGE